MGSCPPPKALCIPHLIPCAQAWRVGCSGSTCRDRRMLPARRPCFWARTEGLLERCKGGGRERRGDGLPQWLWGGGSHLPDPDVPREHVPSFPFLGGISQSNA